MSIAIQVVLPPASSDATASDPIEVTYAPDTPGPAVDRSGKRPVLAALDAGGDGSRTTIALRPFDDCDPAAACDRTIILRVAWRSPRADQAISGAWTIDAGAPLAPPAGMTLAPGTELTIDVQARDGPPA